MGSLDDLFATIHAQPRLFTRHEELGDQPATHRWRAGWEHSENGHPTGITLYPVPVIKLTPAGAWIDPDAWYSPGAHADEGYPPGYTSSGRKRWVANNSGSAWAKPTREAALLSLAVRLDRWAIKVANDLQRVRDAADAIDALLPQHSHLAKSARLRLPREQLDPADIEKWLLGNHQLTINRWVPAEGADRLEVIATVPELAQAIARFYRNGL